MLDCPKSTSSDNPQIVARFNLAKGIMDNGGSLTEAASLLKQNAILGDSDSMVYLGVIYSNGTEDQRRESILCFRQANEAGNHSGTRNLGYCYAIGLNVKMDKTHGADLYRKSMEMGNPAAACNLGVMYDYGNGVPQDFDKAFECYTIAASRGNSRGMTNLGEYYNYGKGTDVNLDLAEKWYLESGSPRAHHRLAVLYSDYPEKKDPAKAMEFMKKSADAGYAKAMVGYADMIEGDEAIKYLTMAAAKGNADAIEKLKSRGLPIPEYQGMRRKKKN